jgi:hypothetical protein
MPRRKASLSWDRRVSIETDVGLFNGEDGLMLPVPPGGAAGTGRGHFVRLQFKRAWTVGVVLGSKDEEAGFGGTRRSHTGFI